MTRFPPQSVYPSGGSCSPKQACSCRFECHPNWRSILDTRTKAGRTDVTGAQQWRVTPPTSKFLQKTQSTSPKTHCMPSRCEGRSFETCRAEEVPAHRVQSPCQPLADFWLPDKLDARDRKPEESFTEECNVPSADRREDGDKGRRRLRLITVTISVPRLSRLPFKVPACDARGIRPTLERTASIICRYRRRRRRRSRFFQYSIIVIRRIADILFPVSFFAKIVLP
jgi:hypothetical protein